MEAEKLIPVMLLASSLGVVIFGIIASFIDSSRRAKRREERREEQMKKIMKQLQEIEKISDGIL